MYVGALPISRPLAISPLHDQAKKPSVPNFTLFTPSTNYFLGAKFHQTSISKI